MKITGYKSFDKDLKCNGYQYEIGKEHKHDGDVKLCHKGFHFCEHPLDAFGYYEAGNSRFAEIEAEGVSDEKENDTKRVCNRLRIKAEITIKAMIDAAIKFTFDRADWSKKENHVTEAGKGSKAEDDSGAASATGDRGAASATGYRGAASATGKEGCAVALGIFGKAKGEKDVWLTIAEWKETKPYEWHRVDVQTVQVDGKKITADVWYMLKGRKFVEVES